MAQKRRLRIYFPDGTYQSRKFEAGDLINADVSGEWLVIWVNRPTGDTVKNAIGEDVPAPDKRLFHAAIWHGHQTTEWVEDGDE